MKKITLILMIVLAISACQKKGNVDKPVTNDNPDQKILDTACITLKEYDTITNIDRKIKWLKEKGDRVCKKTLEQAVLDVHQVKGGILDKKGTYDISWAKLKGIIKDHGYDSYLRVATNMEKEKIDSLHMVPEYKEKSYCFSTALIRSLAKKHAKGNNNAKFQFSLAKLNDKSKRSMETVVVIQVNGAPYYYDYSTEPPFISIDNKPL
ncbi:hypothetical protein [Flavobacterium sharifuzzamanii]|uniref:hypothetical protein n=1 Tax=Flavobacterium sharifuzzamanii TaxID=2211133 RepID=UPI000DAD4A27|nr:hypothetical protein [Flavobacterium sharifuzzamanii]KAF2082341.1 hypothetical protein DMA14_03220 [Flavobacterium sharifuzzamanii]